MTLADLHNIPKFAELFSDARFIALLHYQREHIIEMRVTANYPEMLIWRGAHKEGWLDAINDMQDRVQPPKLAGEPRRENLYAQAPR